MAGVGQDRNRRRHELVHAAGFERPHAGIVLSLARQEEPDTAGYKESEIVRRIRKPHHAGLIVASEDAARVRQLLDSYVTRFYQDFHTSAPPPSRATD